MKFLHIHSESTLSVYMNTDTHLKPYEAQMTTESGSVRRGWGSTPRDAIIDAITDADHTDNDSLVRRLLANYVDEYEGWIGENAMEGRGDETDVARARKLLADMGGER